MRVSDTGRSDMQDTRTGDLIEIPDDLTAQINNTSLTEPEIHSRLGQLMDEARLIPTPHQGPIISVGEEIDIKGGRFSVLAFSGRLLVLQGEPVL
jgi:hypothetical protein